MTQKGHNLSTSGALAGRRDCITSIDPASNCIRPVLASAERLSSPDGRGQFSFRHFKSGSTIGPRCPVTRLFAKSGLASSRAFCFAHNSVASAAAIVEVLSGTLRRSVSHRDGRGGWSRGGRYVAPNGPSLQCLASSTSEASNPAQAARTSPRVLEPSWARASMSETVRSGIL